MTGKHTIKTAAAALAVALALGSTGAHATPSPSHTIVDGFGVSGPNFVSGLNSEMGPIGAASASFTCRASVARVKGLIEPLVANAANDPCVAGASLLPGITGPVEVYGPHASTSGPPFLIREAIARTGEVAIAVGPGIYVGGARADARVTCSAGIPGLSSSSWVVKLKVGATFVEVPAGHFHFPIPNVGTLHLNETITTSTSVTRRAIWLVSLPGALDVVVAEARAGVSGNPCHV